MPPKPRWFKKVRQIKAAVERSETPFLDRQAVEKLFGVRARRAQQLLRDCGGEPIAGGLAAPRSHVLEMLDATLHSKPYQTDTARRQRVATVLQEAMLTVEARAVRFPVPASPAAGQTIAGLPHTIRLSPGELRIACKDAQDLLQQLYQLSRAIAREFEAFEDVVRVR